MRRADVPPDQLLANPKNYRRHTKAQKDAFRGLVKQVGYVDPVLVQDGTDIVIDGHLRVEVALEDGIATVPVDYYDGTQAESDLILATKDPLAAMAYHDAQALDALMRELVVDDPAVVEMLADLRGDPVGFDPAEHWAGMPEFHQDDQMPVKQLTVSFYSVEAITKFAELIGQTVTMQTKGIAFPRDQKDFHSSAYLEQGEADAA